MAGDVNCDREIDIGDALFILQFTLQQRQASEQCPPPKDHLYVNQCDVSEDGECDIGDALIILQCTLDIYNDLCPDPGNTSQSELPGTMQGFGELQGPSVVVTAGSGEIAPGAEITIPVTAEVTGIKLGATEISIVYDPAVLEAYCLQSRSRW